MPRSVLTAVIGESFVVLLGLYAFCVAVSKSSAALRLGLSASVFHALVIVTTASWAIIAIFTVRGLIRRSARARQRAFSAGLVISLFFGVLALIGAIIGIAMAKSPGRLVHLLVELVPFIVPFATVAWSLSRPSARAWFTSAPNVR